MEAVLAGAIPVLPDRCSYAEMYRKEFLYPSVWTSNWENYQKYKPLLVEFIQQRRGIQKVTIIGHSAGTGKVLRYANLYPDNVEKLVLCGASWRNPAIVPGESSISTYRNFTSQDLKNYVQKGIPVDRKAEIIPTEYLDALWAESLASDPTSSQTDPSTVTEPNGWLNDLQLNWTTDGVTPLWNCAEIYVPVLVTTGEWDITSPPQWQKNTVADLVNAPWKAYVELKEGAHFVAAQTNRMTLFSTVQQFLDQQNF